jgi:hypothetical protein
MRTASTWSATCATSWPPIYGGSSAIQRNNIANLMKLPRD